MVSAGLKQMTITSTTYRSSPAVKYDPLQTAWAVARSLWSFLLLLVHSVLPRHPHLQLNAAQLTLAKTVCLTASFRVRQAASKGV